MNIEHSITQNAQCSILNAQEAVSFTFSTENFTKAITSSKLELITCPVETPIPGIPERNIKVEVEVKVEGLGLVS